MAERRDDAALAGRFDEDQRRARAQEGDEILLGGHVSRSSYRGRPRGCRAEGPKPTTAASGIIRARRRAGILRIRSRSGDIAASAAAFTNPLSHMLKDSIELHRLGRLEEAEQGYREHLEAAPNDADALHLLGLLRHQRGASAEAEDLLARAHALAPEKAGIELALGTVRFQAGDLDGAAAHWDKALALDPNVGTAHSGLGQIALMQGERDKAEQHFRIALRAGEDAQALTGLGSLLLE